MGTSSPSIRKLADSPSFVVRDLADDVAAVGLVRNAKKILQDGAKTHARSITYGFASFGQQRGGASAGISAIGEDRDAAVASFTAELTPSVADGSLALDHGKGVQATDLAELAAADTRPALHRSDHNGQRVDDRNHAFGVAHVAALARPLDGATVAVEVFDTASALCVGELVARGAKVTTLSTETGTVAANDGFDPVAVSEAWAAGSHEAVAGLGGEATARNKVFGADVDVLVVGSKVGALTHMGTPYLKAAAVVPNGVVPISTKAFVELRSRDVVVVPDFVSCAGRLLSWYTEAADGDALQAETATALTDLWGEIGDDPDGPLMAACTRAEAFLATWQQDLPFGRPLA
jgi:hypothetical protein